MINKYIYLYPKYFVVFVIFILICIIIFVNLLLHFCKKNNIPINKHFHLADNFTIIVFLMFTFQIIILILCTVISACNGRCYVKYQLFMKPKQSRVMIYSMFMEKKKNICSHFHARGMTVRLPLAKLLVLSATVAYSCSSGHFISLT